MSDANEAIETEAPATASTGEVDTEGLQANNNETDDEAEGLDAGAEGEGESQADAEADEFEEIEHGGKKLKLHKELKPLLMFQQDYTRKTQQVAEEKRALESEREAVSQQASAAKEHARDLGRLSMVEERLDQYAKVDWQKLNADDFVKCQEHLLIVRQLEAQRDEINTRITTADAKRTQDEQHARAKRVEDAVAEAQKIPGWSPEVAKSVETHARSYGLSTAQLDDMLIRYGAPAVKAFHAAWLGAQIAQKQQQATKRPVPQKQPDVIPPTKVEKGKSTPVKTGLHDDLSPEEWVRRRQAEIRNKRA